MTHMPPGPLAQDWERGPGVRARVGTPPAYRYAFTTFSLRNFAVALRVSMTSLLCSTMKP